MGVQSYRIIDTDTHVIEPADLWTSRLPRSWGEEVLHVKWDPGSQAEMWFFGDQPIRAAWHWANWGWPAEGQDAGDAAGPVRHEETHPATQDVAQRVAVMDAQGVEMQVLYPNLAGFDWAPFVHHPNPELAAAHISAYNDFQLDWVRAYPGRFIPMLVVPYWDLTRSVAEIERLAGTGFGGIVTTGAPQQHGQAPLSSRHWDPLWRSCEETGLSVSFHAASGDFRSELLSVVEGDIDADARVVRDGPHLYLENGKHVVDLLMSGVMARFPTLQFVSVESGIGWVPFVLETLDKRFFKDRLYETHPEYDGLRPSDFFRRQMSVNFWYEELQPYHIETIGLRSLLFETDFPHPTGFNRASVAESIEAAFAGIDEPTRQKILWDNPARLYAAALSAQGVG